MTAGESDNGAADREEDLAELLAAFDEALRRGGAPPTGDSPPDLQGAQDCLRLLEAVWPRSPTLRLSPGEADAAPPTRLAPVVSGALGRFQIRRELGRGGFGTVYLAFDPRLGREVALKVPHAETLASADRRARFQQEARAAAGLNHPNLVPVYEAGEIGSIDYIALAYCPGITLAAWLHQRTQPVPVAGAAELVATLAEAVHHAHRHGVVHRDLKPANVILQAGGPKGDVGSDDLRGVIPRITDFGLAKHQGSGASQTQPGTILGTPTYMAPEQTRMGGHGTEGAADVYSLGAILYELLAGRPPFQGETAVDTLHQVRFRDPVPPRRLRPSIPRDLETICQKAMEKDPRRRYPSALALADDLRRYLRGDPIHARPIGPVGRAVKWARRQPAAAALLGVSVLAAGALLAILVVSNVLVHRQQQETERALGETIQARNDLAETLERERRMQYFFRIRLASAAWQENNVPQALEFLEACLPSPGDEDLRGWEWWYLRRLCNPPEFTFRRHKDTVHGIAFSPDGKLAASVSQDGTFQVWDSDTGQLRFTRPAPKPLRYHTVAFSPDGKLVALASQVNDQLTLWNVADGSVAHTLRGGSLAFRADGLQVGAADFDQQKVRLHDVKTGAELRSWDVPLGEHCSLAFHPTAGLCVAYPGKNGERIIHVRNAETGKELFSVGHTAGAGSLAFSPDGTRLAAGYDDGTAGVWDTLHGTEEARIPDHPGLVMAVGFSPDGQRLAVGDSVGSLTTWGPKGQELLTLRGPMRAIFAVAFSPDGRRLASGGGEWTVRIRDASQDPEALVFRGHSGPVKGVAFSPDSSRIASSGVEGTVKVWRPETGRVSLSLVTGPPSWMTHLSFSRDGDCLLGCNPSGDVSAWEADSGRELRKAKGSNWNVGPAVMSPLETCFATGDQDKVQLWDARTGERGLSLRGHKGRVRSLAFSSDGRRLASGGEDAMIKLWNVESGGEVMTLTGHAGAVEAVAFSADGTRLASGGHDSVVRLWDSETGAELKQLHNRRGRLVQAVAFSPDGLRIASAGFDQTVTLWDPETGQEALTLRSRRVGVGTLVFSPDGRRLAAASNDSTVTVWDASP